MSQGGSSGDDGQSLLPAGGKAGIFEFCTILYHSVPFWGVGSRRGRVGGFGAGPAGGKAGIFDFCTILYHFVPFWGVGSRRGRVGGFGAGAAFGHDTSRASVAGLDWVRRYGRDLTCIHDKGSLGGWARGKCQWWGRWGGFSPPLNLPLRKGERSSLVQTGETGNRLSMNIGNIFLKGERKRRLGRGNNGLSMN